MSKNDETKNFGSYLRHLRLKVKPKKITQGKIGEILGATRQYIDRVEKQKGNTTPPKLEYLLKILEVLKANPQERYTFLWLAFKDRIHTNWDLYRILHTSSPLENKKTPTEPVASARPIDAVVEDCWYKIHWILNENTDAIKETNEEAISKVCIQGMEEMDVKVQKLCLKNKNLEATVSLPTHLSLAETMGGLKALTSRMIRNRFPELNLETGNIWENGYGIRTIVGIDFTQETVESPSEKKVTVG